MAPDPHLLSHRKLARREARRAARAADRRRADLRGRRHRLGRQLAGRRDNSRPVLAAAAATAGLGGLLLAVPWWAHGRRRAKVRVERKLAAWPAIARDVGLPGSEVISAIVDLWGWRARLRLARGQTIADVTGKIPAIESGLGIFRGALRVYPTADNLANRCELRVLNRDPHAGAIGWPATPVTSITQPVDLGPFEDAEPCRVLFLRRHALLAGTTGSGKSGGLNVLMANLSACADVVIWAIDLKQGMELAPWASCIDRLATTPGQATALLRDATAILHARAQRLTAIGRRTWEPSPDAPALVIIIDEYAELPPLRYPDTIARLGRSVAVTLVAATQRPTQRAMGEGAVRSQMDLRICFRVRERRDTDLVLGQGMAAAGWDAHKLNAPGKFLISATEHDTPRRARAYLLTDDDVAGTAARHAPCRPPLDEVSRAALAQPLPPDTERHARHSGNSARARRQRSRNRLVGRAAGRPGRGGVRARPGRADRDEPPLDLLPSAPARRRRPSDPDRARPMAGKARP